MSVIEEDLELPETEEEKKDREEEEDDEQLLHSMTKQYVAPVSSVAMAKKKKFASFPFVPKRPVSKSFLFSYQHLHPGLQISYNLILSASMQQITSLFLALDELHGGG